SSTPTCTDHPARRRAGAQNRSAVARCLGGGLPRWRSDLEGAFSERALALFTRPPASATPSSKRHAFEQAPHARVRLTPSRSCRAVCRCRSALPPTVRCNSNGEGCFPATPRLRRRATSSSPWHNAAFLRAELLLPVPFGTTGAV